jgi:hypothetical protein
MGVNDGDHRHDCSAVSGVPWSFTAHRWDIRENNLIAKMKTARAVRVISRRGVETLRTMCPGATIVHLGRLGGRSS